MRLFHAGVVCAAFCLVTAAFHPAFAAGNVLLPSNQDNSSDTDTSSDDNSMPDTSQSSQTPQQTPAPSTNLNLAPPPGAQTQKPVEVPKLPTTIMKVDAPPQKLIDAWTKKLPFSLTVSYAENPVIGPQDKNMIKTHLGIEPDKAADVCSLVLTGHVQTDKGYYMPFSKMGAPITIKYAGKLSNASMMVTAACTIAPLPSNSGLIMQFRGKNIVMMAPVNCPTPSGSFTQLVIHYNGDNQGQCEYK